MSIADADREGRGPDGRPATIPSRTTRAPARCRNGQRPPGATPCAGALALVLLLGACSSLHVWPDPRIAAAGGCADPATRPVSCLRRLALLPFSYQVTRDGRRRPDVEVAERRAFEAALPPAYLMAAKGYQLVPLAHLRDLYADIWVEKFGVPLSEFAHAESQIRAWALAAADGMESSPDVADAVRLVARVARADGVLVLQGRHELPSADWYLLLPVYWVPFLIWNERTVAADIFDGTSGRLVWRSRGWSTTVEPREFVGYPFLDMFPPLPPVSAEAPP